jgi:DNA-binding NarL/FixJ family response regulator
VIRIDVLVSCPVYLVGLYQVLHNTGIAIVSVRTTPTEEPSWLADTAILDADALPPTDTLHTITQTARTTPVLILLSDWSLPTHQYLQAGATAAINKRETADNLINAIRTLTTGTHTTPHTHTTPQQPHPPNPNPNLSEREEQVLHHISHGLTHGQIATRLGISPHTVDTYVKRIRAKLGAGNKAELTRAALLNRLTTPITDKVA